MRGITEPTKNRPSRAAGPRRATDDDDDSSVGSSSSEASASSDTSKTWAEPAFECGPTATAADVNAASNSLLGKRKEHPDQDSSSSSTTRRNPSPSSHLDFLMQGQVFYNPRRQPSEEEVERFVKFVKENIP